jgi:4,5-DOPA dioxygenase extradiol
MNRKTFLKTVIASSPLVLGGMKLKALNKMTEFLDNTSRMPVLFLGHGSPMNGIEENEFVQGFRNISSEIETPKAIIVISAHWETNGTQVTAMENPRTIHDFGGFPKELYEVQYPAPGMPKLASEVQSMATSTNVSLDDKWGLDHGAWTVIKHMYPKADIPVIQLSLDYLKSPLQHYELAGELSALRNKGILFVGSGNIVHNLRMVHWQKLNENFGYDWAIEADEKMKNLILNGDHKSLIDYTKHGRAFELAIPTPEHYIPLLYALALQGKNEELIIFNDEAVGGSVSMTSLKIA